MKLTDFLKPEYIEVALDAGSKDDLIEKMVELAARNPHVLDAKKLADAILEREKIMSTGVGKSFAIPHGKTDAVDDIVLSFATTKEPVDYAAMDNEPVSLVLLLVSRENLVGQRLKLLARASKIMNSSENQQKLLAADSPEAIFEIFRQEEARLVE